MHDKLTPDVRGLETDAYDQGGYFTLAQARGRRVSRQLLDHHVRRGRFQRVQRGLYRLSGFPSAEHDEMREIWMAVGVDRAVLTHESALALLELSDNIPDAVHLLVARRHRGMRARPGVAIHTRPDDEQVSTVWRDGLTLTAPARTLVDVVDSLQPEQAEVAVRQALERGLATERQIADEAARRGKRAAIEAVLAGARAA